MPVAEVGDDLAVSADGMRWFQGTEGGSVVYANWGASITWRPLVLATVVASSADGRTLAASFGDSIELSPDFGTNWNTVTTSLTNVSFACLALSGDGQTLLVGTSGNFVYLTTNAGLNWKASAVSKGPIKAVACSTDVSKLLSASGDGLFISQDLGASWQLLHSAKNVEAICCSADAVRIAAVTSTGEIHLSLDSGANWTTSTPAGAGAQFISVACSGDGSSFVAAVSGGLIYRMQLPLEPKLKIASSGTAAVLTWPYPSQGFQLQESTNLLNNRWNDVVLPSRIPGTNWQFAVTVPLSSPERFYRLFSYESFQGTFTNLDFESAKMVRVVDPYYPFLLDFSPAFPGWTGYFGTNLVSIVLSNTTGLDGATVSLFNSRTYNAWVRSEGDYFAMLQAGYSTPGRVETSLRQTGAVDTRAKSLQFRARGATPPDFTVTLDGEVLNLVPWFVEPQCTIYREHIAKFAGRTVELRLTVFPAPSPSPPARMLFVDSILFSPEVSDP